MLQSGWQCQIMSCDFLDHLNGYVMFVDQGIGDVVPEAMERLQSASQSALDSVSPELIAQVVTVTVRIGIG